MTAVLRDHEAERAVLGAVMLAPSALGRLLNEEGLRPEHFARLDHAAVLQAMAALHDRGERPDTLTLRAELQRSESVAPDQVAVLVDDLAGHTPDSSSWRSYARQVMDLAHRRQLKLAAQMIGEAADTGDMDKLSDAEQLLTSPADVEPSTWAPREIAERMFARLDSPAPQTFRWPFSALDNWTGGGLRRKQIVLIGGWTSNGKSVLFDQVLERLAGQGLRVHSYINEMSEEERTDRTVARLSGVPFWRVHSRDLRPEDRVRVDGHLTQINVGMTECAGWTAAEIARHIRWNRWDACGVDIVHEIAHREERDLAEIAQTLRAAAKQTDCILVLCVHLNDNRVTQPQRPTPVLRDVRGSGMLVRGADVVLMVHRDDNEDGVPTLDGSIFAAKIRNGSPSAMKVRFDPDRMRFLPRAA